MTVLYLPAIVKMKALCHVWHQESNFIPVCLFSHRKSGTAKRKWPQVNAYFRSKFHMDLEESSSPGREPVGVTQQPLVMTKLSTFTTGKIFLNFIANHESSKLFSDMLKLWTKFVCLACVSVLDGTRMGTFQLLLLTSPPIYSFGIPILGDHSGLIPASEIL